MDRKIAFLMGEGFEDSEFRVPYDRLRTAGFPIEIVGTQAGMVLTGKRGRERVRTDLAVDDARVDEYLALLIPGGDSPESLSADQRVPRFVQEFESTQTMLAAIDDGVRLLMVAGLVSERTVTGSKSLHAELARLGGNVLDEPVAFDRHWITGRSAADVRPFSDAIANVLSHPSEPMYRPHAEPL